MRIVITRSDRSPTGSTPTVERNWRSYVAHAYDVSAAPEPTGTNASVTIVEFSDFQCPYCRRLAFALDTLASRYPGRFRVLFHNYPLDGIHPSAYAAAEGAVCAHRFGRFTDFYHTVFTRKNELDAHPMTWFAELSGVRPPEAFQRCMSDPAINDAVQRDLSLGQQLHVAGTPTVLIDSLRFDGAPPLATLDSTLRALLRP